MTQSPTTSITQESPEPTYPCAGCGRDVPETEAVLLPCCDAEWVCPSCHTGGTECCEACWDGEDQRMVQSIR